MRASTRSILDAAISDGQTAVVWLLLDKRRDEAVTFAGVTVEIAGVLEDGVYRVEFWETYAGDVLQTAEVTVESGVLTVGLPTFDLPLKNLALIIRPTS